MKKVLCFCLLFATLAITKRIIAQEPKKEDSSFSKTYVDSLKKVHSETIKIYIDSLKNGIKKIPEAKADTKWSELRPVVNLVIVVAFFAVMIVLLVYFFKHIKENKQRIGYQSIKLIGLILIFPGICILAIVGGTEVLSGQTLAVLLGTIAGYVLSRDDDSKDTAKDGNKVKDDPEKKEVEFKDKIKALEDRIKSIKEKNPGLVE